MGCSVWSFEGAGATVSMQALPDALPAVAGPAWGGSRSDQRVAGTPCGTFGDGSALPLGIATGLDLTRSKDQSDGRVACGAAIGRGSGELQRRAKPIPR